MRLFSHLFRQAPPSPPEPAPSEPQPCAVAPVETTPPPALSPAERVLAGATSQERQRAAESIDDPVLLRQLLKETRGRDKNVYRIIKQKCAALLAEERQAAQRKVQLETTCAALERHGGRSHDALFAATLDHLEAQWAQLAGQAPPELAHRAQQALERCRATLAREHQRIAAETAHAAAAANADHQRAAVLEELRESLALLYSEDTPVPEPPEGWDRRLERMARRWAEAGQYRPATAADAARYEELSQALAALRESIAAHGPVSGQAAPFPDAAPEAELSEQARALRSTLAATALLETVSEAAKAAADALEGWERARAEWTAAQGRRQGQLAGLIRKARAALEEGQSRRAMGLRRAIEDKLAAAAPPEHLARVLQQLDDRLKELADWKSYAVAPKRAQIVEEMEALIGAALHPNALAGRIRELQEEWKRISRGGGSESESDWQRFRAAADAAYQPCRDYFTEQAVLRRANLERRAALLAQLSAFESAQDWAQADWAAVARTLRETREAWRRHSPVERAAARVLQADFSALTQRLQTRIDEHYAGNRSEKEALILRAEGLLVMDEVHQALEEVKRLKALWRRSGPVPRAEDRPLWEAFRQHCEAVRLKHRRELAERSAEREASLAQAQAWCEEAEALAQAREQPLAETARRMAELQVAFDTLGVLPPERARALRQRFQRALELWQRSSAERRLREEEQAWLSFLEAGRHLNAYRYAVAQNHDPTEREALRAEGERYIAQVRRWPKGALAIVQEVLRREPSAPADAAAHAAALRLLCVRAEILAGIPTPPEDQALRRDYQMRHLMQGLGRRGAADKEELNAIALEWVGAEPVETQMYAPLLERLVRARAACRG